MIVMLSNKKVEDRGEAKDFVLRQTFTPRPAPFSKGVQVCRCAGQKKVCDHDV